MKSRLSAVFLNLIKNNCKVNIVKTSEKLLIWMFRTCRTQQDLAKDMNITRQTLANKIKNNDFDTNDMVRLKSLGFNE